MPFPLDGINREQPLQLGGLAWNPSTFKYLGIQIYHDMTAIGEGNLGKAIRGLKASGLLEVAKIAHNVQDSAY